MLDTPKCVCGAEEQSAIHIIRDCGILRLNGLRTLWILSEPLLTRRKKIIVSEQKSNVNTDACKEQHLSILFSINNAISCTKSVIL